MRTDARTGPRTGLALLSTLSTLLLLGAAGCPGELEDRARWSGNLCEDVTTELFPQRCAGNGCHSGDEPAGGLDLVSPGVEERLIGHQSTSVACGTAGMPLLDPSDPATSLLFQKLAETPPCGARMPLTGDQLTEIEQSCVMSWIQTLD